MPRNFRQRFPLRLTGRRRLAPVLAAATVLLAFCASLAPEAGAAARAPGAHGTVTGVVTDAHGHPLKGICVHGLGRPPFPATNAAGRWRVSAKPGTYEIVFSPGCGNDSNWVWQRYTDGKFPYKSARVIVTAGHVTARIDGRLELGGAVTGQVTSPKGKLLSGICVDLVTPHAHYVASPNFTNGLLITTGKPFALTSIEPGHYKVQFMITTCGNKGNYANQYWHNALTLSRAAYVTVERGKVVSGIDQRLPVGATITGRVTGTGGVPLAGICVELSGQGWYPNVLDIVSTNASGYYRAPALTTGKYYVDFDDPTCGGQTTGYQGQNYPGPVQVTDGKVTRGIDAALVPTGS
jgi:hypothetical protein